MRVLLEAKLRRGPVGGSNATPVPLVFNRDGDCLAAKLRPGNVHSADGWDHVLLPVIDRCRAREQTVVVRADARGRRRGIVKVEHHLGELSPRVSLIVTTPTGTNRAVGR